MENRLILTHPLPPHRRRRRQTTLMSLNFKTIISNLSLENYFINFIKVSDSKTSLMQDKISISYLRRRENLNQCMRLSLY